jgi:hypothetical protein
MASHPSMDDRPWPSIGANQAPEPRAAACLAHTRAPHAVTARRTWPAISAWRSTAATPALSTCLSDILFARGHLDERQHRAALRFRQARAALYGVVLGDRDPNRPEATEERLENAKQRYDAMVRRLTVGQKLALSDVALDVWPRWLRRQIASVPLGSADLAERRDLIDGLDALGREELYADALGREELYAKVSAR